MYKGEYLLRPNGKLLIDNKNVTHAGLPIGDGSRIEKRQMLKPDYLFVEAVNHDPKGFEIESYNQFYLLNLFNIKGDIPGLSINNDGTE